MIWFIYLKYLFRRIIGVSNNVSEKISKEVILII